jgi:hypothetical protein
VAFRSLTGMSALDIEPPSADGLVVWLDEVLADLAAAVAESTPVADAVRIDRIARLEKLRAATAALQAAGSVRCAQSQVAEQLAADVHSGYDRSRHRRTDRTRVPYLPLHGGAPT